MPIATRQITVTLFDFDGTPLSGSRVIVELPIIGFGVGGTVSPGRVELETDSEGVAVFTLWQNDQDANTFYQISSWHPETNKPIHRKAPFNVGSSDANVRDLIQSYKNVSSGPTVTLINQSITFIQRIVRIVTLGPSVDSQGNLLTYSVSPSSGVIISGNTAAIHFDSLGAQSLTVAASNNFTSATATISATVTSQSVANEYSLPGVVVA